MRQYETYKCDKCGCEVEVQKVGEGAVLTCCGEPMKCITEDLTQVNLMKAFAGESQARNKYDLYGDLAKEAGFHAIARHFYEAAENEKWHARAELKAHHAAAGIPLDKMDKNLIDAAAGERYEHESMYPAFAQIATEEGKKEVARLFNAIGKVEVEHEREYNELQKILLEEGFFESFDEEVWVCEVCGHVHRGKKAPGACPLCKAPKEYFKKQRLV